MSTIWTPSGERPVRREPEPAPPAASPPPGGGPSGGPLGFDQEPTEEELRAHLAEVQRQLLETPASVVIANHCIGLFQLAALHLEQNPPRLPEAKLAIDAMRGVIDAVGARMDEEEQPLRDALAQLQMAYVQRQSAAASPPPR